MTTSHRKPELKFALCVHTDDPDLLTLRRVYRVLPDESAARSDCIRVVDNEGEDYLYPASYFILVDFPPAVERALLRSVRGVRQKRSARRDARSLQDT